MTYKHLIQLLKQKERYLLVLVLASFALTIIIIRIIVHLQLLGIIPEQAGPVHIHHMVIGIIMLLIVGLIAVGFDRQDKHKHTLAIFFGIGAALTIDEFALWLFLKDVYWQAEGADSVIAIVIVIALIIIGIVINEVTEGGVSRRIRHHHKRKK